MKVKGKDFHDSERSVISTLYLPLRR